MSTFSASPGTGRLVVEGLNDQHLVLHLCRIASPNLEHSFEFHNARGLTNVINSVRGLVNQRGLTAVGFVVDADETPLDHWRQVVDRIADAYPALPLPDAPETAGTVISQNAALGSPRIGIWVMPDNQSDGQLEDFVAQMIPDNDLVWPLSQEYIAGIPPEARKFDLDKIAKSEVHAWLAARRVPGLMGIAVREGDLAVDGPLCQRFVGWLGRLFG